MSDLLPELQFHRHDRVLLTAALLAGLAISWSVTLFHFHGEEGHHDHEQDHGHEHDHDHDHDHDQARVHLPASLNMAELDILCYLKHV